MTRVRDSPRFAGPLARKPHLANGDGAGAGVPLHDGWARLSGRTREGLELDVFARGVQRCWEAVVALGPRAAEAFDWTQVPPLPRRH